MYITVKVQTNVARLLQGCQAGTDQGTREYPEYNEILEAIKDMGIVLEPMYIDEDGSDLATYFVVEVPDQAAAEKAMIRLLECRAVESASLGP
jgi:hypothetical protein